MAETKVVTNPLVTIGIPAFQRDQFIAQAIQSALSQTYKHLEIVISDNGSTDQTWAEISRLAGTDERIRCFRQDQNLGPTRNFEFVLQQAKGDFFLWLGDDDWLDLNYVEACLAKLLGHPELSVCGGLPLYYRDGQSAGSGAYFEVSGHSPARRCRQYLRKVSDNGIFYGVIRMSSLKQAPIRNRMGWDWILFTSLAYQGGILTEPKVHVHRRLGGATTSYARIAEVMALPGWNATFPYLAITLGLLREILFNPGAFPRLGPAGKLRYALEVPITIFWYKSVRSIYGSIRDVLRGRARG